MDKFRIFESIQHKYLNENSSPPDRKEKVLPKLYDSSDTCCGCSACFAICPVNAVSMAPDKEGFLYPVVDASVCIRCYKCLAVCTFKRDQKKKGF